MSPRVVRVSISNEQFVTEVVQRVLKALESRSSTGPLYTVDTRLRPHGASGPLVMTLDAFREPISTSRPRSGSGWPSRRARVIFATGGFGQDVTEAVRSALAQPLDPSHLAAEVRSMRRKLEASRGRHDLKRGFGGLADLEFIAQFLELVARRPINGSDHRRQAGDLPRTNYWDALAALRRHGSIPTEIHNELRDAYDFLRTVEGRLRLIHNRGVAELPESNAELERLARRLNYDSIEPARAVETFLADAVRITHRTRELFDQLVVAEPLRTSNDPEPS